MHGDVNIVSLAPAGDLFALSQAASNAKINAGIVNQIVVDEFSKVPLAGKLLASRQGNINLVAQMMEGLRTLGTNRILYEVRPERCDLTAEQNGVSGGQASVYVEA